MCLPEILSFDHVFLTRALTVGEVDYFVNPIKYGRSCCKWYIYNKVKSFSTTLYFKPIHNKRITPWDSHGSIMSKRAVLIGEIKRAIKRSTDLLSRKQSWHMICTLFINNGYPKNVVIASIQQAVNNTACKEDKNKVIYLNIPFVNEDPRRRALSVIC